MIRTLDLKRAAQASLPFLYSVSIALLFCSATRLAIGYDAAIYLKENGGDELRAPYLSQANLSPLSARTFLKSALLNCFDLRFDELSEELNECAGNYFSIDGRFNFVSSMRKTSIISLIENNPREQVHTDVAITQGPSLVSTAGLGHYRFQTVLIITHYIANGRTSTPFLISTSLAPSNMAKGTGRGLEIKSFAIRNSRSI